MSRKEFDVFGILVVSVLLSSVLVFAAVNVVITGTSGTN